LSTYPTDGEIQQAADRAFEEAESLFALLSVSSADLGGSAPQLPGISAWYNVTDSQSDESDSETESDNARAQGDLNYTFEHVEPSSRFEEKRLTSRASINGDQRTEVNQFVLVYASNRHRLLSLTPDGRSHKPELTLAGGAWEEAMYEDVTQIANILAESLPAPQSNIAMPPRPIFGLRPFRPSPARHAHYNPGSNSG
jgi:hypothetical protein